MVEPELAHLNTIVKYSLFVRTRCKCVGYAQKWQLCSAKYHKFLFIQTCLDNMPWFI